MKLKKGQRIKIVSHPENQIVKLKKTQETVTLRCQAESPNNEQLTYTWYYLNAGEKPQTIDRRKKEVRGTGPSISILVKVSRKLKRRYFCDVSVVDQPEYYTASNEAVITLEPG